MFAYIGTISNRANPTVNVVRKLHKRALIRCKHYLHTTVASIALHQQHTHTHTMRIKNHSKIVVHWHKS